MKNLCSHWWKRLLLGATLVIPAHAALASDFQVNPVRIDLDEKTRTALLAVHNTSPEAVRLQVSMYTWSQDAQGKVDLTPTQELSYFPSLLTVEPGQARNVRVGGLIAAGVAEKAYRIIVEQLPAGTAPGEGSQLRMLTRMSIPVFVAPTVHSPNGKIEHLELMDGKVSFSLRNTGNTHVFAKQARIRGLDSEGRSLFDKSQAGWYVLAGEERQFSLEVPGEQCRRLQSLSVEVSTDSGTFPATAAVAGAHCGS